MTTIGNKGVIAHSFTGRHRRIRAEDVFAYRKARDVARSQALDALAAGDADLL